ncbi:MAG: hypothetical protein K8S54_18575 [Spirochaetia bacterium]|nr:hypothetical protein [Spirochaetia bacterium]
MKPQMRSLAWAAILISATALAQTTDQADSNSKSSTDSTKDNSTTQPGTTQNSILPGINTAPNLQEKRPSPRDPRYRPPVTVPGLKEPTNPGALFLFSGDMDAQKWMESRQQQNSKKATRYEEAMYDDLPPGGIERKRREEGYLQQFGLEHFPYAGPDRHEHESTARRFQIVFFISLPITMAASYGIFKLGSGGSPFSRGQTLGVLALGAGLSTGIGYYDYLEYNKLESRTLPPAAFRSNQMEARITFRY